jgi:hypothetical protein
MLEHKALAAMQGFPDFDPAAFLERTAAQVHSSERAVVVEDTAELPAENRAVPISFQHSFVSERIVMQEGAAEQAEAAQQQQGQQERQKATFAELMLLDDPHVTDSLVDIALANPVDPDALAEVQAWCRERGVHESFAEAMMRAQLMSGATTFHSA